MVVRLRRQITRLQAHRLAKVRSAQPHDQYKTPEDDVLGRANFVRIQRLLRSSLPNIDDAKLLQLARQLMHFNRTSQLDWADGRPHRGNAAPKPTRRGGIPKTVDLASHVQHFPSTQTEHLASTRFGVLGLAPDAE